MSVQFDRLDQFPQRVEIQESQQSIVYVRQAGYFAVHLQQSVQPASQQFVSRLTSKAILVLDEQIAIFRGSPDRDRSVDSQVAPQPEAISAVYVLEPGGSIAVPTGQVFLRLEEGVSVETYQTRIQQAGYQVSEILVYAPNAAWLRPQSGNIADALRLLPRLETIDPAAVVEPQMVMGRSKRDLEGG